MHAFECRSMTKFSAFLIYLFLIVVLPAQIGWAKDHPKGGGQPVVLVQGAWRSEPGSWGQYRIHDRKQNTDATMHFAVHQRKTMDGRPAVWLEMAIKMTGQPEVITRVLAEEQADGPGKVLKVIAQPEGRSPFVVPDSMMEDKDGAEESFQYVGYATKVRQINCRLRGRRLTGWEVEGKDVQGRPVYATISQDAPPLGLLSASTAEAEINLLDFGQGTITRIKGEPMNFYLWLTEQMVNGLSDN